MARVDIEQYKLLTRLLLYGRRNGIRESLDDEFIEEIDKLWGIMSVDECKSANAFVRDLVTETNERA